MIKTYIKYRLFLITIILLFCIKFVDSPYFGNYFENPPIYFYFFLTLTNVLIYLFPIEKLILAEKLIYAAIISCLTLIGAGLSIEKVFGLIYGYDSYYGELESPQTLTDALFYFVSNFTAIGIFALCLNRKQLDT